MCHTLLVKLVWYRIWTDWHMECNLAGLLCSLKGERLFPTLMFRLPHLPLHLVFLSYHQYHHNLQTNGFTICGITFYTAPLSNDGISFNPFFVFFYAWLVKHPIFETVLFQLCFIAYGVWCKLGSLNKSVSSIFSMILERCSKMVTADYEKINLLNIAYRIESVRIYWPRKY